MFKKVVFNIGLALLLVVVLSWGGWDLWLFSLHGRILPGIAVNGLTLSGLSEQQARERLDRFKNDFLNTEVTLELRGHRWSVTRKELGFEIETARAAHEAYLIGRRGWLFARLRDTWLAFRSYQSLSLEVEVNRAQAEKALEARVQQVVTPPVEARLVIDDNDRVTVTPGRPGMVLDYQNALKQLKRLDRPAADIILHLRKVQPQVQTEDVMAMKINGLLASYTTSFDAGNVNRTYNINVAADALDNTMIKPGEVFSFNRVVGPRSKEAGYREALVIVEDQFTPGVGGGVCQVSSTLYNAALLAGLTIVERTNHSLPVTYVPLGRDATVSYGGCDLKFKNSTSGCLYLRTRVGSDYLTVKIFGNTAERPEVRLESVVDRVLEPKVIRKEDPNLYQGKVVVERKGVKGYQVRVFSYTRKPSGEVVKRLVSKDLYKPVDQILRVGTMPEAGPPMPPAETPSGDGAEQQPGQPVPETQPTGDGSQMSVEQQTDGGQPGSAGDSQSPPPADR